MGLNHPRDLAAWRDWQESRHLVRRVKHLALPQRPDDAGPHLVLHTQDESAPVLVAVDGLTPTKLAAVMSPAHHLRMAVSVLAPGDVTHLLPGDGWSARRVSAEALSGREHSVTVAAGHFLPVGAAAYDAARATGSTFCVVQHGLLTPFAPPLPDGAHLFAWSEGDADFWISGRDDITSTVVGSQLFWDAGQRPRGDVHDGPPVYLGQLHGAELSRAHMARSAGRFCRSTGATYRPHPAEIDKLSRLQHAVWRRQGIAIDTTGTPLNESTRPVVSAFSTGVVEAACRGIPAWVQLDRPPIWVEEFWDRYGMSRWGDEPTPVPEVLSSEPARAIADEIQGMLG